MTATHSVYRMYRSFAVLAVLFAVYWCYSAITSPFLDVARRQFSQNRSHPATDTSPEYKELAERWFPEDRWLVDPPKHFRDGERFLYLSQFQPINDSKSIDITDIALLWKGKDGDRPITAIASSAQLDLSKPFSLQESSIGRITGGFLNRNVRIRGPRGLQINGHSFFMSEDAMKVWSREPVQFWWEGHRGTASRGVEIVLKSDPKENDGLMSVTDVTKIRLFGKVDCHLFFAARRKSDQDVRFHVVGPNGFEFDIPTRTGTFLSHLNRRPDESMQVVITRPVSESDFDRVSCSQLSLNFRPDTSPETGAPMGNRLRLTHVLAEGPQVTLRSTSRNLVAQMTDLHYWVDERRIELINRSTDDQGRPYSVQLNQNGSELLVPSIRILHSEAGRLLRLECRGRGIIRHPSSRRSAGAAARWTESMVLKSGDGNGQRTITLKGNAAVARSDQSLQIDGQEISMQLNVDDKAPELPISRRGADSGEFEISSLDPRLLIARESVHLRTPQINGTVRDTLTVTFQDTRAANTASAAAGIKSASFAGDSVSADGDSEPDDEQPTTFSSDSMTATVLFDKASREQSGQLSKVQLIGGVEVSRASTDVDQSFVARGNHLIAENGFEDRRQIQLFGDPASFVQGLREIEGQNIKLSELLGSASVGTSGRIRLVTDKGLRGEVLPKPTPIDIYWSDRMTFQGRTAHFVGNIRAVMSDQETHDIEVKCDGLIVHFTRDISIDQSGESGQFGIATDSSSEGPLEIERIECQNRVVIRMDELKLGEVVARHRAKLVNLNMNLKTGACDALGHGWIESRTPDTNGQLTLAPSVTARANTPIHVSNAAFVFMRISFIGDLVGNIHKRNATLSHHVVGIVAPVRHLEEVVEVDTLSTSQLPDQVGIVRAEELTVLAITDHALEVDSFSLTANRNARIESRRFSGDADIITYDHSKRQFILRTENDRIATVYHRPGPEGQFRRSVGKRFEYYPPPRNQLFASQISSLQATE